MKKNTMIQLVLIYVGISSFMLGFPYIIPRLLGLLNSLPGDSEAVESSYKFNYFLAELIRMSVGLILLIKSQSISDFIAEHTGGDNSITIYTKPSQLFNVLLIAMAAGHLLEHLPYTLYNILTLFSTANAGKKGSTGIDYNTQQWLINFCHLLVPVIIIALSGRITRFVARSFVATGNEEEEPVIATHENIALEASKEDSGAIS